LGRQKNSPPLKSKIAAYIREKGPISVADFHNTALHDPKDGYYKTQHVLGPEGDFVTAPELTTVFSRIIGAWIINTWEWLASHAPLNLVELGPGQGTLLSNVLETALKLRPAFAKAVNLSLVEKHPLLQQLQKKQLAPYPIKKRWFETLNEIPPFKSPCIAIANEFFDTLACNQYEKVSGNWYPRVIDWQTDVGFCLKRTSLATPSDYIANLLSLNAPDGSIREHSPESDDIFSHLCQRIQHIGGAALVIDYGYMNFPLNSSSNATWQALYKRRSVSPLSHIGLSDLSFHVNFDRLSQFAHQSQLQTTLTTQREFLVSHGIEAYLEQLLKRAQPKARSDILLASHRLIHHLEMGNRFKVLMCVQG
jgi:SAM-dependent MidA family methyltransferase